jgi:predicted nuclease of predicted toxin-antitoxin system
LKKAGYECIHLSEVGMSRAEDAEILSWARKLDSVIVTLDSDFHAMLAVSGAKTPSVIRVRIQGFNAEAITGLRTVLGEFRSELSTGCLISIKARRTTSVTSCPSSRRVEDETPSPLVRKGASTWVEVRPRHVSPRVRTFS